MTKMIYLIVMSIAILNSCRVDLPVPENPDLDENALNIIWKRGIMSDTSECLSMAPKYYDNGILISGKTDGSSSILELINAETSEMLWQWDNNSVTGCADFNHLDNEIVLYQNSFVTACGDDVTAIDLNNGATIWHTEENGGYQLSGFYDKLFHVHLTGSNPYYSSSLVMSNIDYAEWDTIVTLDMTGGYSSHIYPPALSINSIGDTILYFQNRQWNFSASDGKIDFYAYNMTADSILWEMDDVDEEGNSSVCQPMFYDNKIFFKGGRTVYCFDAIDGHIIWSNYYGANGNDILLSNMLLIDDKLIVKEGHDYLYAVSPQTGSAIWTNDHCGGTPSYMTYYNGNIYYGSGGDGMLHVISANNGETIKEFNSPGEDMPDSPNAGFYDGVAIDPVHNYLYAADGYYLYCIKIDW